MGEHIAMLILKEVYGQYPQIQVDEMVGAHSSKSTGTSSS
jgi:hypothetical protein